MEIVNTNPVVLVVALVVIAVVGLILYAVHKRMAKVEDALGAETVAKLEPIADKAAAIIEEAKAKLKNLQ